MSKIAASALLLIFALANSAAIDVKGLKIGGLATHQMLANTFGSAECPKNDEAIKNFSRGLDIECTVPISYMGIKTTGKVRLSNNWRVWQLVIQVPDDALEKIESILTAKYGSPKFKRGAPFRVSLVNPQTGQTQDSEAHRDCSEWRNVQESDIDVCNGGLALLGRATPIVRYTYKAPLQLDPNDM